GAAARRTEPPRTALGSRCSGIIPSPALAAVPAVSETRRERGVGGTVVLLGGAARWGIGWCGTDATEPCRPPATDDRRGAPRRRLTVAMRAWLLDPRPRPRSHDAVGSPSAGAPPTRKPSTASSSRARPHLRSVENVRHCGSSP